jgi:hypothetical protein
VEDLMKSKTSKKTKKKSQLELRRQTLRSLTSKSLTRAGGGCGPGTKVCNVGSICQVSGVCNVASG